MHNILIEAVGWIAVIIILIGMCFATAITVSIIIIYIFTISIYSSLIFQFPFVCVWIAIGIYAVVSWIIFLWVTYD